MGRANSISLVNEVDDLILRGHKVLSKALNLYLLVSVFEDFQHFMVVKQVIDLAAIDLIHRHRHGEVALVILPVVDTALKQVLHCQILQSLHSECLA